MRHTRKSEDVLRLVFQSGSSRRFRVKNVEAFLIEERNYGVKEI